MNSLDFSFTVNGGSSIIDIDLREEASHVLIKFMMNYDAALNVHSAA